MCGRSLGDKERSGRIEVESGRGSLALYGSAMMEVGGVGKVCQVIKTIQLIN